MGDLKYLTAQIDVSRNAVMKIEELKKFIDILPKMGYNSMVLYTEDLFELPGYEMFGYMRGKYTVKELKDLVAYGEEKGITLMPNIRVLAHMEHIFRWDEFSGIRDNRDLLLVDEEKTYEFIEALIRTMREIYTCDSIQLGCDEAWSLGLGRYIKKFGYCDSKEIFKRHLKRCVKIAQKYGFNPQLSGDMFFRYAGEQYSNNPDLISPEIAEMFPKGAIFGYWDYFSPRNTIENMLKNAKRFGAPISFACSVLSWTGFTPHNHRAFDVLYKSIPACVENGIDRIAVTFWGDDGGECSPWSCLPAFFYAAQLAHGETDMELIKSRFFDIFGISFDDFSKLDYPADYHGELNRFYSCKPAVYSDPFMGFFDDLLADERISKQRFLDHAKELFEIEKSAKEYAYLFNYSAKLCLLMAHKFDLGVRTRKAYKCGDKAVLSEVIKDYDLCLEYLAEFYESFKNVWFKEKKGNGFEVQAIRLGGLRQRLLDCKERLLKFINGEISIIEELEEDVKRIPDTRDNHNLKVNFYGQIASVNTLTQYNFYGNDNLYN